MQKVLEKDSSSFTPLRSLRFSAEKGGGPEPVAPSCLSVLSWCSSRGLSSETTVLGGFILYIINEPEGTNITEHGAFWSSGSRPEAQGLGAEAWWPRGFELVLTLRVQRTQKFCTWV